MPDKFEKGAANDNMTPEGALADLEQKLLDQEVPKTPLESATERSEPIVFSGELQALIDKHTCETAEGAKWCVCGRGPGVGGKKTFFWMKPGNISRFVIRQIVTAFEEIGGSAEVMDIPASSEVVDLDPDSTRNS